MDSMACGTPVCNNVALDCFQTFAVFGFYQIWNCALWPRISFLVSLIQILFQKSCVLFKCNFKLCSHVLFLRKEVLPGNPSKEPILVESFSYCTIISIHKPVD